MTRTTEIITPGKAREYLAHNTHNRAIRKAHLNELTREMRAGNWVENGQAIVFDAKGNLLDGQHRLHACVASDTPFITDVVRGVSDPRAFATIDIGKPRGAHDMATYLGDLSATKAKDFVAAARIVLAYDSIPDKADFTGTYGTWRNEFVAAHTLALLPLLSDCEGHIGRRFSNMAPKATLTALLYIFARRSRHEAFAFFDLLYAGVFSSAHHPVKVLRDVLLVRERVSRKSAREAHGETMALFFKAWAAYRRGKEVKLLRWTRTGDNRERFPELA